MREANGDRQARGVAPNVRISGKGVQEGGRERGIDRGEEGRKEGREYLKGMD